MTKQYKECIVCNDPVFPIDKHWEKSVCIGCEDDYEIFSKHMVDLNAFMLERLRDDIFSVKDSFTHWLAKFICSVEGHKLSFHEGCRSKDYYECDTCYITMSVMEYYKYCDERNKK